MGISDGKEMAYQLARHSSSYPLTGPPPTLDISAKAAREVISGCTNKEHEEYWQPMHRQMQSKDFLKQSSTQKAGE